jgi:1,4-alpha-glucan branching enzyme
VCAPFDAELFGHWWFEGPRWVEKVLRKLDARDDIATITCSRYLEDHGPAEVVSLPEGSWGEGGFHWIWLNDWTEWTWREIYACEEKFLGLLERYRDDPDPLLIDLLRQAGRELLLLQSSDWQFLISTWSARDYAESRVSVHNEDFGRLAALIESYADNRTLTEEDRTWLDKVAQRDPVFPDLDLGAWRLDKACKEL